MRDCRCCLRLSGSVTHGLLRTVGQQRGVSTARSSVTTCQQDYKCLRVSRAQIVFDGTQADTVSGSVRFTQKHNQHG